MPDESSKQRKKFFTPSVLIGLAVVGLVNWALQRSHGDDVRREIIFKYGEHLAIGYGILAIFMAYKVWRSDLKSDPRQIIVALLSGILLAFCFFFLGFFVLTVLISVFDLFRWISNLGNPASRAVVAGLTVLTFGSLLFYIRLRWRSLYGATEAVVGICVAAHRVIGVRDQTSVSLELFIVLLTAGIYLVVRGFDNVHQGLIKEPIDPLATRFVQWWRQNPEKAEGAKDAT